MDERLGFLKVVQGGEDLCEGRVVGVGAFDQWRLGHGAFGPLEDCHWEVVRFAVTVVDGKAVASRAGRWVRFFPDFVR